MARPSDPPVTAKRVVRVSLTLIFFAGIVAAGLFYAAGGRWFVVETPSMGQYAPVGTVVLSSVTAVDQLRVGDMILFRPPTAPGETYFHRIVSLTDGAIGTKGDINGTIDPWTLHAHDLIGHETARIAGLGWLIQALPTLLIGGLILHALTHVYTIPRWRYPVRVFGWSALVSLACYLIKPLIRAELVYQSVTDGTATTTLVPTGLLDVHAQAVNGTSVDLCPGQPGSVESSKPAASGLFDVVLAPHFTPATWALFIVLCLIPLALCIAYALRKPDVDDARRPGPAP